MNLEEAVFDNGDVVAATGLNSAVIQTWANRGILALSEKQRNPGPGQRRQYSGLDIARIAATQSLIGYGLTPFTAAGIALRLERGPTSAPSWRQALELGASHIYILVVDNFDVAAVRISDGQPSLAQLLTGPNEGGWGGEGTSVRLKTAIFDIGAHVSATMARLRATTVNLKGEAKSEAFA